MIMKQVAERYISLLTDFGFKRIFGTAMNKDKFGCSDYSTYLYTK